MKEKSIKDIKFQVHNFTQKEKNNVIIISSFSEFGCEVLTSLYCIPRIKRENQDAYFIVMGWYGRSYLYQHLVDEYWELNEEFQWLRDYSLAFHHKSKNLTLIEQKASKLGKFIPAEALGKIAVGNVCNSCRHFWGDFKAITCPQCQTENIAKALFADVGYWRERMTPIPPPTKLISLPPRPVGVFARNRSTYGRNLQPEFYIKLLSLLKSLNYTPIWLGEKQSTLKCPDPDILDFSDQSDLELTLAIVKQCEFTVQFWTASTRLAGITATPYLLFESPDQLYGQGQEAYRLALCTLGKKKIALCHYLNVFNDHQKAINLVERCINEMQEGNYEEVIGMVDDYEVVEQLRRQNSGRWGDEQK